MSNHFYRDDYLELARTFPIDHSPTVERMLEHCIPAMEEQARRLDKAADDIQDEPALKNTVDLFREEADAIRLHVKFARQRLKEAGIDVPEKLPYHP